MAIPVETLKELLQDMVLTKVAEDAGVSYDALVRFARGEALLPNYFMIDNLREYFNQRAEKIIQYK